MNCLIFFLALKYFYVALVTWHDMTGWYFDNTINSGLIVGQKMFSFCGCRCVSEAVLCVALCDTEGLKALWDDYTSGSKQRKKLLESRYGRKTLLGGVVDCLSEGWVAINSKNCPCCFSRIQVFFLSTYTGIDMLKRQLVACLFTACVVFTLQKDGGCNVMTCSRCGRMFCWSCLTKLSSHGDGHFDDGACTRYT